MIAVERTAIPCRDRQPQEKSLPPGGLGWGGPAANGDPTAFLCIFDTLIFSSGLGHTSDLSENSELY